jgi:alpha-tubulin suppressor-like RCC1 family protein
MTFATFFFKFFEKFGQLGLGHQNQTSTPTEIEGNFTNVKEITSGRSHSIFITNEGNLYGFGRNTVIQHFVLN